MNAGDGAVLEILHTSEELRPKVTGSIVGGSGSGKVADLGPITEPFPIPSDGPDSHKGSYLWTFELARQRVRISRSAIGWIIFLLLDAVAAALLLAFVPGALDEEAQSWPYVGQLVMLMFLLPLTIGMLAFIFSVIAFPFTIMGKLWSRRRRFPKKLDLWK